jgi:rsbT co-antagonist protein RsbR
MRITQRQSIIGFLILLSVGGVLASIFQFFSDQPRSDAFMTMVETAVTLVLLYSYWRGWEPARYLIVVLVTIAIIVTQAEFAVTAHVHLPLLLPPIIALIFLRPLGVAITGASVILSVILSAFWFGTSIPSADVVLLILLVGGIIIARMVLETALTVTEEARQLAERAAISLEQANTQLESQVEQRTAQLQLQTNQQAELVTQQAKLLEEIHQQQSTIRSLSVPVIPISNRSVVLPLVGELDAERLNVLQQRALQALKERSAKHMVLDITGVPIVDTAVAQGLLRVVRAARLLGAEVALVGVRPEVAESIVSLGIDLENLATYRDLASVFE